MTREELIELLYLIKKWVPNLPSRDDRTTINNEIEQIEKELKTRQDGER